LRYGTSGLATSALIVISILSSGAALAQSGACNAMTVGQLKSLNGFVPFAADSLWNTIPSPQVPSRLRKESL
jgi:hypothetical protein